jgi:hypothetical protein
MSRRQDILGLAGAAAIFIVVALLAAITLNSTSGKTTATTGQPTSPPVAITVPPVAVATPTVRPIAVAPIATPAPTFVPSGYNFTVTGSLLTGRSDACAVLLHNGRVLVAGGSIYSSSAPEVTLASAELYDPSSETFSPTGSLTTPRTGAACVVLADGRVLIAGGSQEIDSPSVNLASAEIYNPATGTFAKTGSMKSVHLAPAATRLANGDVLIAGGYNGEGLDSLASELYHPASGTFSPVADSLLYLQGQAVLLPDGRVFSVGFADAGGGPEIGQLYNPSSRTFSLASLPELSQAYINLALLPDGEVLMVAGNYPDSGFPGAGLAQTYDPIDNSYHLTGPMSAPGNFSFIVPLQSGRVLLASDLFDPNPATPGAIPVSNNSAMIYDPTTNTFANLPDAIITHSGGIAVALNDGRVLLAGGGTADWNLNSRYAELLWGDRP